MALIAIVLAAALIWVGMQPAASRTFVDANPSASVT